MNFQKPAGDSSLFSQQSFWLTLIAVISAVPSIVEPIAPFVDEKWRGRLLALSAVCAALAARFARWPGVEARAAIPAVEAKVDVAVAAATDASTLAAQATTNADDDLRL